MTIGVIGAGAWGTALAQVIASGGEDVILWAREGEVVESINKARENSLFLSGFALNSVIRATGNLGELAAVDTLLVVVPAQFLRSVLADLPQGGQNLILCTKGIEQGTGRFMHDTARECAPSSGIAVLSGPTFAHEVAAGMPTAITLACEDGELGAQLAARIARPHFRP